MAERVAVEEKSLEDLEREITCPICQEHYTEPKVLPCLHYYCRNCILKLSVRTQSEKPFCCPECRCEVTLPEGGVDDLKTAFFANRLKSKLTTLQRAHGKVEVKCELCTVLRVQRLSVVSALALSAMNVSSSIAKFVLSSTTKLPLLKT